MFRNEGSKRCWYPYLLTPPILFRCSSIEADRKVCEKKRSRRENIFKVYIHVSWKVCFDLDNIIRFHGVDFSTYYAHAIEVVDVSFTGVPSSVPYLVLFMVCTDNSRKLSRFKVFLCIMLIYMLRLRMILRFQKIKLTNNWLLHHVILFGEIIHL